jgi:hypothetical protein
VSRLTVVTVVTGLVLLAAILELLRRRQLREKYALLWLVVGLVIVPLALFPRLLDGVAEAAGVVSGVSLVLFLGFVFLLVVTAHLSWEVSRLEEETRTLAEDLALLRLASSYARRDPPQPGHSHLGQPQSGTPQSGTPQSGQPQSGTPPAVAGSGPGIRADQWPAGRTGTEVVTGDQ